MTVQRCGWCSDDPLYIAYHDQEWGQALLDENRLFEMLCLEGQQAGLAWITVLRKREAYREHFFQYSIESIALNRRVLNLSVPPFALPLCRPLVWSMTMKIIVTLKQYPRI